MNKTIVITSIVAIGLFALAFLPSQLWLTQDVISQWVDEWLPANIVIQTLYLFIGFALAMTVGLPRQIAAIVCGYILGSWQGVVVALCAASFACFLTASGARYLFSKFVHHKFAKQQQAIYQFISVNEFTKALIIRLLPVGSNFLTNIVAGTCRIKLTPFVLGSTLGFIPQMVVFSLVGAGVKLSSSTHLILALILFMIAFLLGTWLYFKEKQA